MKLFGTAKVPRGGGAQEGLGVARGSETWQGDEHERIQVLGAT